MLLREKEGQRLAEGQSDLVAMYGLVCNQSYHIISKRFASLVGVRVARLRRWTRQDTAIGRQIDM